MTIRLSIGAVKAHDARIYAPAQKAGYATDCILSHANACASLLTG